MWYVTTPYGVYMPSVTCACRVLPVDGRDIEIDVISEMFDDTSSCADPTDVPNAAVTCVRPGLTPTSTVPATDTMPVSCDVRELYPVMVRTVAAESPR